MRRVLPGAAQQAGAIAILGLAMGVVSGWAGLAADDEIAGLAARSASWFPALAVVLPIGVMVSPQLADLPTERALRIAQCALAALLGGVFGSMLYLVGAVQIPAVFGGLDSPELMRSTRDSLSLLQVGAVIGVSTLVGLALGAFAGGKSAA